MSVGILQHKGNINKVNKLKSSALGKNPWAYRIGTPQRFIFLRCYSELATAKPLVEFFLKWV
jgi:hypothetical protein